MSTIRYTIKTQHCAPTLVAKLFDGFEIVKGIGFWKGKPETCVSIAILGTEDDRPKVLTLARQIREQYRQEEVWVTAESVTLIRVSIDKAEEGIAA